MKLWLGLGPTVVVGNMEILMQKFPALRKESECSFLLGTLFEKVDREVSCKQNELLVSTLKGALRARLIKNRSRAVHDVVLPHNWL